MTRAAPWDRQKALQADIAIPTHGEMVSRILGVKKARDRFFLALMYLTAGRVSEVIGVTQDHFTRTLRGEREILVVRLTNEKSRTRKFKDIPVPLDREGELGEVLTSYLAAHPQGSLLGFKTRERGWQICTANGFNPHFFRHIRLTHLVTVYDFNDQLLMRYAGWTSPKEARHYIELRWHDFLDKI